MRRFAATIFVMLISIPSGAETTTLDSTYKQPYPHSSGAQLLPYCEQTDVVVSQLRCDYYVQGVADLATIPQQGKPLACIPQGQNRTQLMQIAVGFLKTIKPDRLEKESAASLILNAFTVAFPCPKEGEVDAIKKEEAPVVSKDMTEAIKKAMTEAQQKKAAKADE
jgi:Rap1a immunity proteins